MPQYHHHQSVHGSTAEDWLARSTAETAGGEFACLAPCHPPWIVRTKVICSYDLRVIPWPFFKINIRIIRAIAPCHPPRLVHTKVIPTSPPWPVQTIRIILRIILGSLFNVIHPGLFTPRCFVLMIFISPP